MTMTTAGLSVLETLRQIRERAVEEATGKLSQQARLCQRYLNNITALKALSECDTPAEPDAAQLHNRARFRAGIQRVIDWQQQQQALAAIEQDELQQQLKQQACREMILNTVIQQQKDALERALRQQAQKNTDAMASQSWLLAHPVRQRAGR